MPLGISNIEHEGVIQEIDSNKVIVNFIAQKACDTCHVKSICAVAGDTEKKVEVVNSGNQFNIGEKVNIIIRTTLGLKAMFLAYFLPFLVVLTALFLLTAITKDELLAGFVSVSTLLPYYIILSMMREKLKKTFTFHIEKLD